jgi:hypothetical protein
LREYENSSKKIYQNWMKKNNLVSQ